MRAIRAGRHPVRPGWVAVLCLFAASAAAQTTLVTRRGVLPNFGGDQPAISADGRYVVFRSTWGMYGGAVPAHPQIYLLDRTSGEFERISVSSTGATANESSGSPLVSADGRYVAFESIATNLVAAGTDTNGQRDVFVRDRVARTTTRVSLKDDGSQFTTALNSGSSLRGLSDDGQRVLFLGPLATPLPWGDTLGSYVRDRTLQRTFTLNLDASGAMNSAVAAALSADGRTAVLVGGFNLYGQVLWRDLATGAVESRTLPFPFQIPQGVHTSGDGTLIVFSIQSSPAQVWVFDRRSGALEHVSESDTGDPPDGNSDVAAISSDGRVVAFRSHATNLLPAGQDTNGREDVYIRDRVRRVTFRANVGAEGAQANWDNFFVNFVTPIGITADGGTIVYPDIASNLAAPGSDTYSNVDVYLTRIQDFDEDSLPSTWEVEFGLDPYRSAGDDGAAGDPDADGISNVGELAAGSHPRGLHTRYFAEGVTGTFFDTRLALFVPGGDRSRTLVRYMTPAGTTVTSSRRLNPRSRTTIEVDAIDGLADMAFSTVVESDRPVVVDRTVTWDSTGYGSHAETGIPAPATRWYLAEGATHSGFQLFYLILNPGSSPATVLVEYLLPSGAPVTRSYAVGAGSRANIWVNTEPSLSATDVSAIVTSDQPIIVERAMYLNRGSQALSAGHASAGLTTDSTNWFLAEGATGSYFDLFVLIANPGATAATVQARYLRPDGVVITRSYAVPARSRFTIWVDAEDERLADTAVSTAIVSDVPVLVERAMW